MDDKSYVRMLNELDKKWKVRFWTDNDWENVYLIKEKDLKYIPIII